MSHVEPQHASALQAAYDIQREAFNGDPAPDVEQRRTNLKRLLRALVAQREKIADVISSDFGGRSRHESLMAEIFVTASGIRHAISHLRKWAKPEARPVAVTFKPGTAKVHYQPLGVVGVIAPWNYPVQLSILPLATALAAGNRVMLKPSEMTPNTSAFLAEFLKMFPEDLVSVHEGGVELGQAFSALPFDHLFYTGSTQVGRLVMKAAAANLTPVTLELGGKSPAVVHRSYSLEKAAARIVAGKMFNAGQTCIAPDYALVPRGQVDAFVGAVRASIAQFYPRLADNPDYTSVVNERHRTRLEGYLSDAAERGAQIIEVNPANEEFSGNKMPPRLLTDVKDDMVVMQDEIFGPILPIVAYDELDDALAYINDRPRPLALYYFDKDKGRQTRVLERTHAGGVTLNDTLLHVAQEELPFGGIGPSGMGAYHGEAGFRVFSHAKSVFYQARFNGAGLLNPPYGDRIEKLLDWLI